MTALRVFDLAAESPRLRTSAVPAAAMSAIAWRRLICLVEGAAGMLPVCRVTEHQHFVYNQTMDVERDADLAVSGIAAAIGEPARVRMLFCLMDGHARTSTELAVVAEVTPSTASGHLARLREHRLVKVFSQGKYRYYSLAGPNVADALEALQVAAGSSADHFVPSTPTRLRTARICYDHLAGAVAVSIHNRFMKLGWLTARPVDRKSYHLTPAGTHALEHLGIDVEAALALRRRFAFACLDWSERQPHIGGALGAALLKLALKRRWVVQDLDSRALSVTRVGKREMDSRFGLLT